MGPSFARRGMDAGLAHGNLPVVFRPFSNCFNHCFQRRLVPLVALSLAGPLGADPSGNISFDGNPAVDSDAISTDDGPQRRWLSHPGGRLCLNPSSHKEFRIDPLAPDLPLDIGAYGATGIIRLPRVLRVRIESPGVPANATAPRPRETWTPYQLRFVSQQPGGGIIEGSDFFPDSSPACVRILKAMAPGGSSLVIEGDGPASLDAAGDLRVSTPSHRHALSFHTLEGPELRAARLKISPAITPEGWSLRIPISGQETKFALAFGFASPGENGQADALRAAAAVKTPIATSLAAAKSRMDAALRKVPSPGTFGISSATSSLSAKAHHAAYYASWAFLLQSTIDPLPDHPEYPFPQMSLGKGALWAEGHPKCPATCGWESFLGIQTLAWIDADFGWRAYEGIMSLVDEQGQLGGESLPSRKAHTAWVLHQRKPDPTRLAAVYPAIRRYLLWRERNPRWIYGDNMAPDERDIEFAASWMVDVDYAIRIAEMISHRSDVTMWREKQRTMIGNMRSWFFRDPERLHQFYFTESNVHATPQRNEYRPVMILSALATPGLPNEMRDRLISLFDHCCKPSAPNAGFAYTKYPDNQFLAWGLIDHRHPQARPFVEAMVRDSTTCGEFAETIEIDKDDNPFPGGVKPSLFTALNLIEFTWLLNGVRTESGSARPFKFSGNPP
jgi:hypothetical protein